MRRIYKICDRNGKPCHNCRKTHKKVSLTARTTRRKVAFIKA